MLVQRKKTANKMIFLWLGIAVMALVAGFFVYQNFLTQTPGTSNPASINSLNQLAVPSDFGEKIFSDPRFNTITNGGASSLGYTSQIPVTAKSKDDISEPTTLKIFNPATGGKLVVSWSASSDSVTGYDVYRSESLSSGFEKIGQVGPDFTNYADTHVRNGTQYYYRIKATRYTEFDRASVAVDAASGSVQVQQIASGGLLLSWDNPAQGAIQAITITRKDGNGIETPLKLGLSDDPNSASLFGSHATFEDPDGNATNTYSIVWYSSFKESSFSGTESNTPSDTTPPDSPADVEVLNVGNGTSVMLRWTNPLDPDFDYVKITRSSTQGEIGSAIKSIRSLYQQEGDQCTCSKVLQPGESCIEQVAEGGTQSPEGNCFIDEGDVRKDETYYYTVTSVDINGNESTSRIIGPYGNTHPFTTVSNL